MPSTRVWPPRSGATRKEDWPGSPPVKPTQGMEIHVMTDFERFRFHYLRASFMQAKQEGKLPQWFLKQGLFWLLRMVFTFVFAMPLKFIWRYTGRDSDGLVHFVKFFVVALIYLCILGGIVCAPFMRTASAAAQ